MEDDRADWIKDIQRLAGNKPIANSPEPHVVEDKDLEESKEEPGFDYNEWLANWNAKF